MKWNCTITRSKGRHLKWLHRTRVIAVVPLVRAETCRPLLKKHAMLAILLAAGGAAITYFSPPFHWVAKSPPREMMDQGVAAIWLPAKFDGRNIMLVIHPPSHGETLGDAVSALIQEERADGRTIISTKSHRTCHGKENGANVEMRFGSLVSQSYHVAVTNHGEYALIYTHSIHQPVDASISRAIDSFCPP